MRARGGRVSVMLEPSRELCGTTPEQFAVLLEALAPFEVAARREREDRPGRQRAPGAGRKPTVFSARLLVALTHLWTGGTTRQTAVVFGCHERSVRRFRDEVVELLVAHGCQPPGAVRPIRTVEDLTEYLNTLPEQVAMLDGTEVRRSKPARWSEQRKAWSGKTRQHVVKATIVSGPDRRPVWFEANPTGEGRRHDITMLRAQTELLAALAATTVWFLVDGGYRNLDQDLPRVIRPRPKPPGGELSDRDLRFNRTLSSMRMPVEHAIGRVKWWKALRYWRRHPDRFNQTGRAITVLDSLI